MNESREHDWVYFLGCDHRSGDRWVKIGTCGYDRVIERRRELQVGNPLLVYMLAYIEGDASLEAKIHQHLSRYRLSGEWFRLTPEVEEWILDLDAEDRKLRRERDRERKERMVAEGFEIFLKIQRAAIAVRACAGLRAL